MYPFESSLTHEDARLSSLVSLLEPLKSGTTCVIDSGSYWPEATVDALGESGMGGVVTRSTFDISSSALGTLPDHVFAETTQQELRGGAEFVDQYNGLHDGRITAWLQLRVLANCSDELCREVKVLADQLGTGFQAHASFTKEVHEAAKLIFGKSDVARLCDLGCLGSNLLLAHMGWLSPQDVAAVLSTRTNVVLCPTSSNHQAMGSIAYGRVPEPEPEPELLALGACVCLGTDGGAHGTNDPVRQRYGAAGGYKEVRLDATVMLPESIIEMATLHGARAAGLEQEIGSIEVGKKADTSPSSTRTDRSGAPCTTPWPTSCTAG